MTVFLGLTGGIGAGKSEALAAFERHGAATLYRISRATAPQGPWIEVGSATSTRWVDIDALKSLEPYFYRVTAENSGGGE